MCLRTGKLGPFNCCSCGILVIEVIGVQTDTHESSFVDAQWYQLTLLALKSYIFMLMSGGLVIVFARY